MEPKMIVLTASAVSMMLIALLVMTSMMSQKEHKRMENGA